jgi:hypothetical protein
MSFEEAAAVVALGVESVALDMGVLKVGGEAARAGMGTSAEF